MLSSEGKCASAHGERGRPAQRPNSIPPQSPRADLKRSGYRQGLSLEQRRILGQVEPRPQRATILRQESRASACQPKSPRRASSVSSTRQAAESELASLRHPRSAMEPRRAPPQKGAENHGRPATASAARTPSGTPPARTPRKMRWDASQCRQAPRASRSQRQGEVRSRNKAQGSARAAPSSAHRTSPATSKGGREGRGGRLSSLAPHRHSRSRMAASFFSPIPDTRVKSSMDLNGPFASRSAMIFSAVAAPTPLSVSSSSAVAVLMLTRPSVSRRRQRLPESPASWRMPSRSAAPGGMPPDSSTARRDDDLLTVLHLLGQVHRVGPRLVGGSSCRRHGVYDATARLQIVDARRRHAAVHMDADAASP